MQYLVHKVKSSSSWFTDRKSLLPSYSSKKIILNFQGGNICFLVLKILSLTLSVCDTAKMEAAKSNFLQHNMVPLYQLRPLGHHLVRLPSCFGRSRGVGAASEAMVRSSCSHGSSSSAATLSCISLRRIPAVMMNLDQSLRKALSYLGHLSLAF